MDFKKLFLAAIVFMIVAQVVHTIGAVVTMDHYLDSKYFSVWSKMMMPKAGPPPAEFFYFSIAFGFIAALIYTYAYAVLRKAIPGKDYLNKGLSYGSLIFLIGTVPGSLSLILLINLPMMLIITWAVEGLVIALVGGVLIAKIVGVK